MKLKKRLFSLLITLVMVISLIGALPVLTVSAVSYGDSISIKLLDNIGRQLGTQTLVITQDDQYTISAYDLSLISGETGFYLSSKGAKNIIKEDTKITLDKILINGISYNVPKGWINVSPWGSEGAENDIDVCPWNPWWRDHSISLDDETLINTIQITFTLRGTGLYKSTNQPKITNVNTTAKPIQKVNTKKVTKLGKVKIKPVLNYKAKKVKIKWKKVRGATGYQYKISLNKKYKKAKIKSTKKKSFSFKFKLNKNYKVGVRAYKKVGNKKDYGKWTIKNIDFHTK